MSDTVANFIAEVSKSLSASKFVKLTLSNYKGADPHLQKVAVRIIDTGRGRRLAFQNHYATRQTVKNYEFGEAIARVREHIGTGFRSAHLFTTVNDFQLTVGKRSGRLIAGNPTFTETLPTSHDREKKSLVSPGAPYLKALGITTDKGEVRAQQRDKWRQIHKYVEILADLLEKSSLTKRTDLKVVDMGSGKGYLTFAAYEYFTSLPGMKVEMRGVEAREDLVDLCNQVAESCGFEGLKFVTGNIVEFDPGPVDMLIALHACDTATDDALYKGISANAEIIVAAPCCHKEIRRQIDPPEVLRDIMKHGSLLEREAETITDGLRGMLLERSGYTTRIFEFVASEHTPKNNMIVAIRSGDGDGGRPEAKQHRINELKRLYGIREQRLENLLA
ncbi:MAG: SAM-dependent methyltransferase [Pyrinomonadaceae bacterium]